jgi:hypothetical protein
MTRRNFKEELEIDPFADMRPREETYRRRTHGNHPWTPEEQRPRGTAGCLEYARNNLFPFAAPPPSINDCLAWLDPAKPWRLIIWEPLLTKAPSPPIATPYCCYTHTIIFYRNPYVTMPPRGVGSFADYGQIESRLRLEDIVRIGQTTYEIGTGHVMWGNLPGERRRWWMRFGARRIAERPR